MKKIICFIISTIIIFSISCYAFGVESPHTSPTGKITATFPLFVNETLDIYNGIINNGIYFIEFSNQKDLTQFEIDTKNFKDRTIQYYFWIEADKEIIIPFKFYIYDEYDIEVYVNGNPVEAIEYEPNYWEISLPEFGAVMILLAPDATK